MMIKHLIMDVDGSLTDGKIYIGNDGESMKAFSVKDGYAINFLLKPAGIDSIIITGRNSSIVEKRCNELGITHCYQGVAHKLPVLEKHVGKENLGECAYFGDDILDLTCMIPIREAGGIVGCPADAVKEVKAVANYICVNKAGEGAMREFSEWLVQPKNDRDLNNRIEEAIRYIWSISTDNLKAGRYEVNEYFSYTIQEYETRPVSECKLESHREYVDIQWIVSGEEAMDIADISGLQVVKEYSSENDVTLWKPVKNMMRIALHPGSYAVLYPKNAHMGCITLNKKTTVKKIVGKIRIHI